MRRRVVVGVVLVALMSVVIQTRVAQSARPETTAQVVLSGTSFQPDEITVTLGDTVEWNNQGGFHTVTSDDGLFNSGDASSEPFKFTHTFTQVGSFKYHCEIHDELGMVGTVIVESADDLYLPQLAKIDGAGR